MKHSVAYRARRQRMRRARKYKQLLKRLHEFGIAWKDSIKETLGE